MNSPKISLLLNRSNVPPRSTQYAHHGCTLNTGPPQSNLMLLLFLWKCLFLLLLSNYKSQFRLRPTKVKSIFYLSKYLGYILRTQYAICLHSYIFYALYIPQKKSQFLKSFSLTPLHLRHEKRCESVNLENFDNECGYFIYS